MAEAVARIAELEEPRAVLRAAAEAAWAVAGGGGVEGWLVKGQELRRVARAGAATEAVGAAAGPGGGAGRRTDPAVSMDGTLATPGLEEGSWARVEGLGTAVVQPVVAGGRRAGALVVFARRRLDRDARAAVRALAEAAGLGMARARLAAQARRQRQAAEALGGLADEFQRAVGVRERAEAFVRCAGPALGFDRVAVFLPAETGPGLCLVALGDAGPEAGAPAPQPPALRVPLVPTGDGGGALAVAWRTRRAVVAGDDAALAALPRLAPALAREPVLRSRRFAIVPLVVRGVPLGLVAADNKRSGRPLAAAAIAQLTLGCRLLAPAIGNALLYQEAQGQRRRLEHIFTSISDGILMLDAGGRVAALNPQGADLLGLGGGDLVGQPVERLTAMLGGTVAWQARGGPSFEALLEGRSARQQGDIEVRVPRPRTVAWRAVTARDAAGGPAGITLTLREVTREREVDRMKSEFVSMVAHELRTPLTSIKGSLDLLLSEPDLGLDATQRELLELGIGNTDRLIRLVNDILDIAKIEAGRIELRRAGHAVEEFVRPAVAGLRPLAADRGVVIDCALAPDLPPLAVDLDRMVQVVTNLLSNAVKFSPRGGRVRVEARCHGPRVVLRVADEGPGIPASEVGHLFQKFRQLQPGGRARAGGTGLGLAISRAIVEQHGGQIGVEPAGGRGATLFVALPVEPGAREAAG